jgi:DNA-binding SARP family transcriptional activator/tetratricopeptide (TPR) repeat protein
VDFRVLGPVEALESGQPLALHGARQRALLALLLLQRGAPMSVDRLVDELWSEHGAAPDKTLQVAVSRLRSALGQAASRLVRTPAGYRLHTEPGELDVDRFERLAEEGRQALLNGSPEHAAARLRAALEEWRGPPLGGIGDDVPFADVEATRLEAERDAALEDRIEADLALGRHAEVAGELEALVAREPLRERRRGQLMLALFRTGRQGEALEAFRDGARVLDAELGLRPGSELERLQRAILTGDAALDAPTRSHAAEAPASARRATATILFTDLAGSTPMRAALGDEAADAVRREHDGRLRDVLALHGGREVKALGDGLMAVHEAAGDALACAVDMQRAIDRQSRRGPEPLGLRIGLGAGDVGWEGDDCFGTPVVEAQRLCASADAGHILAADAVRLLAGGEAANGLRDVGALALPGLADPVRAWDVPWMAERAVAVPSASALARDGHATFAGREAELATARAAWDEAAAGRRRVLLISGEPGIGKTRLAAEIAAHAAGRGAIVLYGHCDDGLAAPAQPFAEALGAYVAACPVDELRVQLGARAADLHPVVPELRALLPRLRAPAPADPDLERLRACEAVAALLAEAGAVAPVLLVLDDLHWADELSLQLLRHLAGGSPAVRVLVLATYRDTEASRSPLLADVVAGLARAPDAIHVPLGPLPEEAVAALLEHAGRAPELAGGLHTATHGNPFFVGELVQALGEHGTSITPRVRDVVRGRLARLTAGAGDLLAVAAVAGPEFDLDVIAPAAGLDTDHTLDALEAAEQARLVVPAGRLDRFTFAHALVRQAIVEDLPASRKVRMHARIARALERAATVRAVPAGELALQLDAAGSLVDARSALTYARRAGDEATARLAFDVAADHYERALRAYDRLPAGDSQERRELDLARARARQYAGDPRAYDMLRRVAADAEAAGDGARMAEALLEMGGLGLDFLNEDGELIGLLRRALALVPPADGPDRARLLSYLALRALFSIPDSERSAIAAEAVAMARRTGDSEALASTLVLHSWTVMDPERVAERLAIADELVALHAPAIPFAESVGHVLRFMALVELGDLTAADAALARGHASARVPAAHWTVMHTTAIRAVLAGDLAGAETLAVQAGKLALAAGMLPVVVQSTSAPLIWFVRALQGRLGELEALPAGAFTDQERPAWTYLTEAQLARARNDRDAAAAHFARAVDHGLLAAPRSVPWAGTLTSAADVCSWLGDGPTAAQLHALLAPCAGTMMPTTGPIGRPVGALARTLGRHDEAEQRLRDAVAQCEAMGAEAHLAVARLELGKLLGPSDEGRRLVAQAGEAADRLGMARVDPAAEDAPMP